MNQGKVLLSEEQQSEMYPTTPCDSHSETSAQVLQKNGVLLLPCLPKDQVFLAVTI